MNIVINIPEQVYEDCLEYRDMDNTTIYNAIRNGIPLNVGCKEMTNEQAKYILFQVIGIVFSNMYPEYKEDSLFELLEPYKMDKYIWKGGE